MLAITAEKKTSARNGRTYVLLTQGDVRARRPYNYALGPRENCRDAAISFHGAPGPLIEGEVRFGLYVYLPDDSNRIYGRS
jgi:hypothetical protein